MAASDEDIKKLAQVTLRTRGYYSGEIDGDWGSGSEKAFAAYLNYLQAQGLEIGEEDSIVEEPAPVAVNAVVVLDPGHGGAEKTGGSSPNNATSASGVLEKAMTLDLARAVKAELEALSASNPSVDVSVHLTRTADENLGLADRARVAADESADVFLSLHFNGFNGRTRGTETWITSVANGNVNEPDDRALAQRVQAQLFDALRRHDPQARNRGVKDTQKLGVLKDVHLGNTGQSAPTRACLVEVEFIDVPEVDALLNGPGSADVNADVARSLAEAIFDDVIANA